MAFTRLLAWLAATAAVLLLASCGGGGSPGDIHPGSESGPAPGEPNAFLLFPNPQVQPDGSFQTNTPAYAQAYYAAIDPNNLKDTLAKWKAANGFDSGAGAQVTAVFGDARDLGFGRRMTARQNNDGTLAFYVENYLVKTGGAYKYSPINLEAAIVRDPNSLVYLAGIEFSPGPAGGRSFAKFFSFNVATGEREVMVDIDGRGDKAMPGPCLTCHGGRADALTPPDASGKPRFSLLQNAVSRTRGDTMGQLPPFEVDSFQFSTTPGYTRVEQEAALKTMNRWVLCSYPLPAASAAPEDACRRPASSGEWQGTAAALVKASYGGDGLPNPVYADVDVPASWTAAGQATLYKTAIAPACRQCHIMRGTGMQSDIDFTTYEKFRPYADRTFATVVNHGNMPLAKLVYDLFHASSGEGALADFLGSQGIRGARREWNAAATRPSNRRSRAGSRAAAGHHPPIRHRQPVREHLRLVDRVGAERRDSRHADRRQHRATHVQCGERRDVRAQSRRRQRLGAERVEIADAGGEQRVDPGAERHSLLQHQGGPAGRDHLHGLPQSRQPAARADLFHQ